MADRFSKDIKRIVGIDPNQSKLSAAPDKPVIAAKRGIAFSTNGGKSISSLSGVAGTTTVENAVTGQIKSGPTVAGQGSLNPYDLSGSIKNESTGTSSAEDLIDGISDQGKISQPQTTADGLEYLNTNALNKLTAVDCDTGEDINIYLTNNLGFPDQDWDGIDPTNPAYLWESGVYYQPTNPNTGNPPGNMNQAFRLTAYLVAINLSSVTGGFSPPGSEADALLSLEAGQVNGYGDYVATYDVAYLTAGFLSTYPGGLVPITAYACTPPDGVQCPTSYDPPYLDDAMWVADGAYNLGLSNGQFSGNQYDPELPLKYQSPVSQIDYCFGDSRTGTIEATKDNGFMIYETSSGSPTGIVRVYDSAGMMVDAGDATNAFLANYRP